MKCRIHRKSCLIDDIWWSGVFWERTAYIVPNGYLNKVQKYTALVGREINDIFISHEIYWNSTISITRRRNIFLWKFVASKTPTPSNTFLRLIYLRKPLSAHQYWWAARMSNKLIQLKCEAVISSNLFEHSIQIKQHVFNGGKQWKGGKDEGERS